MFETKPVARNDVAFCTNISCWLNGAEGLVRHAEQKLGCELGESTADGRVYLKREEECVAACCGAPVVVINGNYQEKIDTAAVDERSEERMLGKGCVSESRSWWGTNDNKKKQKKKQQ